MQEDTTFEDNNINVIDETVENNSVDIAIEEEVSTPSEDAVDVEKLKETNRRLYARLKEAETEVKKIKSTSAQKTSNSKPANYEADLLRVAKGYDDELIGTLEVISKGSGKTLIQAQEDPMFKLLLAKIQEEERANKAKLGASKGSSQHQAVSIKNMTPAEHKEYVKEMMQKLN